MIGFGKWVDAITGTNNSLSLKDKIFNIILFNTIIVAFLLLISDIVNNLGWTFYLIGLFVVICTSIIYFIARRKSSSKLLIIPYSFILIIVFVYTWFNNGGIAGTSLFFLMPALFIIPLFVTGIFRIVIFCILVICGVALLIFELNNPDFVNVIADAQTKKIDMFVSSVLVSFSVLFIMILIIFSYNKVHQKVININESKDKFLSIIAHDLRNPIGVISGTAEILSEDHNIMERRERQLLIDNIYESSERTFQLLDNLLTWAQSESGMLNVSKSRLNLNRLVSGTINLLSDYARNKNISISANIACEQEAFADREMITTVFRNLLSNAIKFTPQHGEIHVEAKDLHGEGLIEIVFKDNGVGMDSKTLDKIFNIDFIFSTPGTAEEKGTGLGLRICKEFIKRNGGEISVKSEINRGSEFRVILPAE